MLYFIKSKSIKTYHMFSSDLLSFIISFKMVYSNSKEICKDLGKFSLEKKKKSVKFHTWGGVWPKMGHFHTFFYFFSFMS